MRASRVLRSNSRPNSSAGIGALQPRPWPLARYAALFIGHDWDGMRAMLIGDVRLNRST